MVRLPKEPIEIRSLMDSAKAFNEANTIKEALHLRGYTYTLSFYGVVTNQETRKSEYRRIEVYLNTRGTERIIELIYRFFQKIKPLKTYSIWLYDKDKDSIALAGEWW